MSYKKRAKTGWNAGKKYKEASNRSERLFEKQEVRQELEIEAQGDNFRYKHRRSPKSKTTLEKMQRDLIRYEKYARVFAGWYWNSDYANKLSLEYANKAKLLRKQIEELENETK